MGVGLVVIATGGYQQFVRPLTDSARRHVRDLEKIYIAADQSTDPVFSTADTIWLRWPHLAWPFPSLLRYHMMNLYRDVLETSSHLLYVDSDMEFVGDVELTSHRGLIATIHPGHVDDVRRRFPYETRRRSVSSLRAREGSNYFCGGIQGGEAHPYLSAAAKMMTMINADLTQGIVPRWHDESVWNRYLWDNPPGVIWGAEYCTPDTSRTEQSKVLALTKDHDLLRSGESQSPVGAAWQHARTSARLRADEASFAFRKALNR